MRWIGSLAIALLVAVRTAGGQPSGDSWPAALARYTHDPAANVVALLVLGSDAEEPLPPLYELALADAHLRAGHLRTAGALFEALMSRDPGGPWYGVAALGRAWAAAGRGHMKEARKFFADAAETDGSTGLLGDFMIGMIDAGLGDASALERFARIAGAAAAPDGLRAAAAIADGYARFWTGDDAGAEAAFTRVVDASTASPLRDEARYAAALVDWRSGDRVAAAGAFRALGGPSPRDVSPRALRRLADLDPRAMLRASANRYRRLPLRMPADQVVAMMQLDVPTLARVALRRVETGSVPPQPITTRHAAPGNGAGTTRVANVALDAPGGVAAGHEARSSGRAVSTWVALLAISVAVGAWWVTRGVFRSPG